MEIYILSLLIGFTLLQFININMKLNIIYYNENNWVNTDTYQS